MPGLWAAVDWQGLLAQFVRPVGPPRHQLVLVVLALAWVGVVVASHLSLRGRTPNAPQRVAGGLLVGVLAFAVAAPMAVAARYSYDRPPGRCRASSRARTTARAPPGRRWAASPPRARAAAADPWADKPRLNVLLLGGDAGDGRTGTRTDTVILASIDTETGDTTLFSLPRNTGRMPFPKESPLPPLLPVRVHHGDGDDAEYFLNAMYDNVPNTVPEDVLGRDGQPRAPTRSSSRSARRWGSRSTTTC